MTSSSRPEYNRGPWWWRGRCWLADLLARWARALEPGDRTNVSWIEGDWVVFDRARRR